MELHETELIEREFVGVREVVERDAIGPFFDRALPQIFGYLTKAGLEPLGPPLGVYYSVAAVAFDMAAVVVVDKAQDGGGSITGGTLPGGRAVTHAHEGHYDGLSDAWQEFNRAVDDAGHSRRYPSWEEYRIGPPEEADPSRWRTVLVQPIV